MAERGKFIVLEGIDNCGKTTQSGMLQQHFQSMRREVLLTREPGGTEVGEQIRSVLLDRTKMLDPITQALLFYSARREFITEIVEPNLARGVNVITDRFELSTFVYQGIVQEVDFDLLSIVSRHVVGQTKPDLYVVIDISAEESFQRGQNENRKSQDLVYEKQGMKFMEKVRQGYLKIAKELGNVTVIDGTLGQDEIQQKIRDQLGV